MIKLEPSTYEKARHLIDAVPFNTLFAKMILERGSLGEVFVDDPHNPSVCLVQHSYGMALLCGNFNNSAFNRSLMQNFLLRTHDKPKYLLAYPDEWNQLIRTIALDRQSVQASPSLESVRQRPTLGIQEDVRLNFRFDQKRFKPMPFQSFLFQVVQLDKSLFEGIDGSVVPRFFWNDYEDFSQNGMGYCLTKGTDIVSTAFCAYRTGSYFELGVETSLHYRSMGLGVHACAALIAYCLKNNLEPVWGCRLSNPASVKLAEKLGFVQSGTVPYFKLMQCCS